ncbi:hypothetical protein NSTC745_04558 [Nostoc sp. DSM 114161]|jgi:hypothetical protein
MSNQVKVFFSYSHKDEALRDELATHLVMMKRQGIIKAQVKKYSITIVGC